MAYAKSKNVWPRPRLESEPTQPGPPDSPPPPPVAPPEPPPALTKFNAEGVLKDALTQVWEQARGKSNQSASLRPTCLSRVTHFA